MYLDDDVFRLIREEVTNRSGIDRGRSSLIEEWDFLDRYPPSRLEDPEKSRKRKPKKHKKCPDCKKYSKCKKLCTDNDRYANQDHISRPSKTTPLENSFFDKGFLNPAFSFEELFSANNIRPKKYEGLIPQDNYNYYSVKNQSSPFFTS